MEGPARKQNRLQNWDYSSPAAYFVTMCTQNRAPFLSEILVGAGFPGPRLTKYGWITDDVIQQISDKYPMVQREKYVIMPNHIHFIFRIEWELCGPGNPDPTISTVMAWFKYQATKEINALDGISEYPDAAFSSGLFTTTSSGTRRNTKKSGCISTRIPLLGNRTVFIPMKPPDFIL